MEAFPNLSTIKQFITTESERFPQSQTMDFHNKADGHERRIATYVVENFRPLPDLEVRKNPSKTQTAPTNLQVVSFVPYPALPKRGHDFCLSQLASPMG